MRKFLLLAVATGCLWSAAATAQTIWGFDEDNNEIYVPAQCDGRFDEENGGVFVPSPQELFDQGEVFLGGDKIQQAQAGYCFMSAAIQGSVEAQLRMAQLYDKGIGLPQNDINAYKWAYMAALNGNAEAARLSLVLEQFLSAEDIKTATSEVQSALPKLKQEVASEVQVQSMTLEEKKARLESINKEIDAMLGVSFVAPEIHRPTALQRQAPLKKAQATEGPEAVHDNDGGRILFNEDDRM